MNKVKFSSKTIIVFLVTIVLACSLAPTAAFAQTKIYGPLQTVYFSGGSTGKPVTYHWRPGYGNQMNGWGDSWFWVKSKYRSVGAGALVGQAAISSVVINQNGVTGGTFMNEVTKYGPKIVSSRTYQADEAIESHANMKISMAGSGSLTYKNKFLTWGSGTVRKPDTLKNFPIYTSKIKC